MKYKQEFVTITFIYHNFLIVNIITAVAQWVNFCQNIEGPRIRIRVRHLRIPIFFFRFYFFAFFLLFPSLFIYLF